MFRGGVRFRRLAKRARQIVEGGRLTVGHEHARQRGRADITDAGRQMQLPDLGQIDDQLVAFDPCVAIGGGELVAVGGSLWAVSGRIDEQAHDQIAEGDRTRLRQAQADAFRQSRARFGEQERRAARRCDQQLLAERDHVDGAVLGQQIVCCGRLRLRADAEHGLDPGIVSVVPAGPEMAARLCVQQGRNPLRRYL
jgi:hypothetical protein